ncbi:MAG: hypothetical protein ABI910_00675 [Gemmatimonadota bacterium]
MRRMEKPGPTERASSATDIFRRRLPPEWFAACLTFPIDARARPALASTRRSLGETAAADSLDAA